MVSKYYPVLDRAKPVSVITIGNGPEIQMNALVTPQQLIHLSPSYNQVRGEILKPEDVRFVSGPLTKFDDARSVIGRETVTAAAIRARQTRSVYAAT